MFNDSYLLSFQIQIKMFFKKFYLAFLMNYFLFLQWVIKIILTSPVGKQPIKKMELLRSTNLFFSETILLLNYSIFNLPHRNLSKSCYSGKQFAAK